MALACLFGSHGSRAMSPDHPDGGRGIREVQLSPSGSAVLYVQAVGGAPMLQVADARVLANVRPLTIWDRNMVAARWSDDDSSVVIERAVRPGEFVLQVFPAHGQDQAWLSVTGYTRELVDFGSKSGEVFALERAPGGLQLSRYSLICHCQETERLAWSSGEANADASWPNHVQKAYARAAGGSVERDQPNDGTFIVGYREKDGFWRPSSEEFAIDFAMLNAKGFGRAKVIQVSSDGAIWLADNGDGDASQRYAVYYRDIKRVVRPYDQSESGSTLNKIY